MLPQTSAADVCTLPSCLFLTNAVNFLSFSIIKVPLFSTTPCSAFLFTVVTPLITKLPFPVTLPNEFVPFSVNTVLFAISPKFVNILSTTVLPLFVYVTSSLTLKLP